MAIHVADFAGESRSPNTRISGAAIATCVIVQSRNFSFFDGDSHSDYFLCGQIYRKQSLEAAQRCCRRDRYEVRSHQDNE